MDWTREVSFRLRGLVPWSPPAWRRRIPLDRLRPSLDPAGLDRLERAYDLGPWERLCSEQDWRESLYVLDVLSTHLPADLPPGRSLDVGSKNGGYLPGLATARPGGWDAVELDAHRRYLWGATRRAYGESMAAGLPHCRFVAGDVRSLPGPWALVTWFLPFLTRGPLEAWGLPASTFAPEELLRHVAARVVPGGALLVVNQGEEEAQLQRDLFRTLGLAPRPLGPVTSALSPFRRERFGFLWRAPPG